MKKRKKRQLRKQQSFFWQILIVPIFAGLLLLIPTKSVKTEEIILPTIKQTSWDNFAPSRYPLKISQESPPRITASAAGVFDLESRVFIMQKNLDLRMRPASLTKMMTALVALDYYRPEQVLTVTNLINTKGESQMGLKIGDQLTVESLIYGLLIPSGNDAAYVLAINYPNGPDQFVEDMNRKAVQLKMTDTHYDNPIGIDSPGQFSTVKDSTILAKAVYSHPLLAKIVKTNWISVTDITNQRHYPLQNVNQLLSTYYGAIGIKTGTTQEAGQCLVLATKRADRVIITTILNSLDRFNEAAYLNDWALRSTILTPWENLPL